MGVNDVRQPRGQAGHAGSPGFDFVASKLRRPLVRSRTVRRSSLIEKLTREDTRPVVAVVAPAGYGKTTLLSQWAEHDGQAFAWVSVDERDNDPKVLLTYVAQALDAVQPIDGRVFEALASPVSSVPGSVVPRLGAALASMTTPVVLVLDDVHLLHDRECQSALSVLSDHVPNGSRLVLAGRAEPPLRIARLRAEGRVLELGPGDLSLTRAEAALLLATAQVALGDDDVSMLHQRTEGWAAGLYMAALALRAGGPVGSAAVAFAGDDRLVSEYVEAEVLARISPPQRAFLTRTAVLERMSGALVEAVLDVPDAAATLAELAQSNLLMVPLDRRGKWYRYHHLFRDTLLAELERLDPGSIPVLRHRAAHWCQRNELPEEALEYFMAAGDVDAVARLVEELWQPLFRQGQVTTLQRWLRWLEDRGGIDRHPMAATFASLLSAAVGRPAEAERWADVADRLLGGDADRPGDPYTEAMTAASRALSCRRGVEQMRADADLAARKFAEAGVVRPISGVLQGLACVLSGDLDGADTIFEDAIATGQDVGVPDVLAAILAERALIAMARNQWDRAEDFAGQAREVLRLVGSEDALVYAVLVRIAWHRSDAAAAQQALVAAQRVRPLLTYAQPHFAVQARIELARVRLALGDLAAARTLMREIDDVLKRRPGLGTLVGEAQALRARLSKERTPGAQGASSLTAAELRVLPLLATHLSFPEIGAELFLSPNTVKSQAISVYRKLGVSSRSQAVAKSRELALLEG
ncbi:MAG: LuxR C-terminal-related transcriptional regulator [Streptosporangiaceae bacterium]